MPDHQPVETAWKIHAAVADWTGKVDSKASFVLAIETGVLAGIVQLAGGGHRLSSITGRLANGFFWVGVSLLVLGLLYAVGTVRPQLRGGPTLMSEAPRNFLYFGHLQHWDASTLETEMSRLDTLPMLTRQLVNMSNIAYSKHRRLQRSINCLVVGTSFVGIAALLNG
jgi:hypothetical protein